jgi:hypothetical protein
LHDTPGQIAPSTCYAAKTRPASPRSRRDAQLTRLIKQIHAENYGVHGARKIWHELHRRGARVARCTVKRLMREIGLRGLLRDTSPRTTRPAAENTAVGGEESCEVTHEFPGHVEHGSTTDHVEPLAKTCPCRKGMSIDGATPVFSTARPVPV